VLCVLVLLLLFVVRGARVAVDGVAVVVVFIAVGVVTAGVVGDGAVDVAVVCWWR